MRTKQNRLVALAVAMLASLTFTVGTAVPAAAAEEEYNRANTITTVPSQMELCTGGIHWSIGVYACFKKYGDNFYLSDRVADGNSVYVLWQNQLRNSNGTWKPYRHGRCEFYGGWEKWGTCNKNFYENSTSPNALGGKGSRVRIKACINASGLPDPCWPRDADDGVHGPAIWTSWAYNNA